MHSTNYPRISDNLHVNVVDILNHSCFEAKIEIRDKKIHSVNAVGSEDSSLPYALPGFIDAHVHVESSMLTPVQFARMAVVHGTVGTVSDPHEIANVLGVKGVEFMIENGKEVPFKFCFGAPSCVPATGFETAGAILGPEEVADLLRRPEIGYLAEVMNFPGVLNHDPGLMQMINSAKELGKPIDGHAPGLRGEDARKYASFGISTDHECYTYAEALEKIGYGVHILIREGSAARNFDALIALLAEFPEKIMFCSDDKHPDSLEAGHINQLVRRAVTAGYNVFHVLRAACINPALHYNLPVGLLRPGDPADLILINNLKDFEILTTVIDGEIVAEAGNSFLPDLRASHPNNFHCLPKSGSDFRVKNNPSFDEIRVIEALDGQIITGSGFATPKIENNFLMADQARNLLKIAVINRYTDSPVSVAFIRNFGLITGAIASSVAHDSHNIVVVGCDDESMAQATNLLIASQGGISAVGNGQKHSIDLPIAGIMTDRSGYEIAERYKTLDAFVKNELKSELRSPFMALSFMALLVIPSLKLSDKGLFDVDQFRFTTLFQQ